MPRLDYTHHDRVLDDNRTVYAVVSRRSRGLSVGLNLNPDKVCNFACPYCQVDRTTPGPGREVDPVVVEAELRRLFDLVARGSLWQVAPFDTVASELRVLRDVAFAGDGEPTTSPAFPAVVDIVGRLREEYGLAGVKVVVLTNATRFHVPRVQAALSALVAMGGEIQAKLDAGTEQGYRRVNAGDVPWQKVRSNLCLAAGRWPLTLQCLWVTWEGADPASDEVEAWAARVGELLAAGVRIDEVQVTAVARGPADPRVGVVCESTLESIADRVRALGVAVRVVPGVALFSGPGLPSGG